MGNIYQYKMKVPFDMSDVNGYMKLPQLILLSLQVSSMQSADLGISDKQLYEEHNLVWIVTDYEIQVKQMPAFDQEITIETEALSYNRLFCYRRFSILDQDGNSMIEMMATFVMMDRESRKVQAVVADLVEPYGSSFSKTIHRGPRYQTLEDVTSLDYHVRFYDLDMNGHVNNSKYLDWIFEVMGAEFLSNHIPEQVHLKYVREVTAGGMVSSQYVMEGMESQHQIVSDGTVNAQAQIKWREI